MQFEQQNSFNLSYSNGFKYYVHGWLFRITYGGIDNIFVKTNYFYCQTFKTIVIKCKEVGFGVSQENWEFLIVL